MIHSVDHINIVVSDLERSVRFYTEVLGLEETKRAHLEGAWVEEIVGLENVVADVVYVYPAEGPRIELLQYHSPEGKALPECALPNTKGLRHIALRTNDLDGVRRRLIEAGYPPAGPPVVVPTEVVTHAAGHKVLCYFHDPDGVILELAEYR